MGRRLRRRVPRLRGTRSFPSSRRRRDTARDRNSPSRGIEFNAFRSADALDGLLSWRLFLRCLSHWSGLPSLNAAMDAAKLSISRIALPLAFQHPGFALHDLAKVIDLGEDPRKRSSHALKKLFECGNIVMATLCFDPIVVRTRVGRSRRACSLIAAEWAAVAFFYGSRSGRTSDRLIVAASYRYPPSCARGSLGH
jgi:hypothetical protein